MFANAINENNTNDFAAASISTQHKFSIFTEIDSKGVYYRLHAKCMCIFIAIIAGYVVLCFCFFFFHISPLTEPILFYLYQCVWEFSFALNKHILQREQKKSIQTYRQQPKTPSEVRQ